ncbi:MAG: hypothetical protein R3A10_09420 [Caldilineaceae bacterium]
MEQSATFMRRTQRVPGQRASAHQPRLNPAVSAVTATWARNAPSPCPMRQLRDSIH